MRVCVFESRICTVFPSIERIADVLTRRRSAELQYANASTNEEFYRIVKTLYDWQLELADRFNDFTIDAEGDTRCIFCAYFYFRRKGLLLSPLQE